MKIIKGSYGSKADMFNIIDGWTTQFEIDGEIVGGTASLANDERMLWHISQIGGVKGKTILELGPLEGAHTKMMIEAGAKKVIAIEGLSDCFLKCLIVKEAFNLKNSEFWFADFCEVIPHEFVKRKIDAVLAAGILYHQENPADLIYNIGSITDTVMVWSQVASIEKPGKYSAEIVSHGRTYIGKWNYYGNAINEITGYCGGLNEKAFWMYPSEMKKCFEDAGFRIITEIPSGPTINGDCILFIAEK